eukprot:13229708-Alexandrium_andersonii.AAC.1
MPTRPQDLPSRSPHLHRADHAGPARLDALRDELRRRLLPILVEHLLRVRPQGFPQSDDARWSGIAEQ